VRKLKVIVFDIKGRFAHFRKFYSNSSSLTYGIPPRTTLAGIVAAILGYERDEYYQVLDSDKLYITAKKLTTTSKIIQTLNYIRAENMKDIMIPKQYTQVPFEILTSENGVAYRVYLFHENKNIFDEIEERLINQRFVYPPSLGAVNFHSSINYVDTIDAIAVSSSDFISISTPIRVDNLKELKISSYRGRLIKEKMVVNFDTNRIAKEIASYIYDDDGNEIVAKVGDRIYQLSDGENIVFM